ncbi:transposase family protein [Streptomyces sp. NPDC055722]
MSRSGTHGQEAVTTSSSSEKPSGKLCPLSGDGGYRGSDRIRTPRRGPDGRLIKDRNHRRFCRRRAVAEHTIARLKDHQILRQCRRKGDGINHAVAGVAALHNLKLEIR